MQDRPTPATQLAVVRHQPVAHDLFGHRLQCGIETGAHHQAALRGHIGAEAGDQFAAHLFGEPVRAGDRLRPAELRGNDRLGLGGRRLRGRNDMILGHPVQHPVASNLRCLGKAERVVVVGCLGQGSEKCGLREGQLVERLVEVGLRGRHDAVRTHAEIDLVEVKLEDTLLGQVLLDPHRQDCLARLAGERDLVVQEHVLGNLLCDRRCADWAAPLAHMRQIEHARAHDRHRIDALVHPEILVLGRNESLLYHFRHGRIGHKDSALGGEFGHQPRIAGIRRGSSPAAGSCAGHRRSEGRH